MKTTNGKRLLACLLAVLMCVTAMPLSALAAYDSASAHVNSIPDPVFTYTGEYAQYGQIATGDPFDLTLGWTTYSGGDPMPVGEIKEITLVCVSDRSQYYTLYKDGAAYYGATATVNGNDAVIKGVDSTDIAPGTYQTYVAAEDADGLNTMMSTSMQSFSMGSSQIPSGPGGGELGFEVEPYFFKDGELNESVTSMPIGSEFALSVYVGPAEDVLLMELFSDGEPFHEYVLYKNGEVFYGGKIDNASEGPGWMTGFSSASFEPGNYYLKVATKNGADGTHEPCITFTGESHQKEGPAIAAVTPPDAKEGEKYSYTLKATPKNGGAITWSFTGALPGGLSLNAKTGVISGTPQSEGTYHFTVKATEAGGGSKTASGVITVKGVTRYNVTYYLNGGKAATGADYTAKQVKEGQKVTLPAAPTKSGYRFVYWACGGAYYLPGTEMTVTSDLAFSAEYVAREPLKVTVPGELKNAVGWLFLYGTLADGDDYYLWGEKIKSEMPAVLEVPVPCLKNRTFTKLALYGTVDGTGTLLASYDGTVTENTESVALVSSGANWQTVRGVKVTGLTKDDYALSGVTSDADRYYYEFPFMTAKNRSFTVNIYPKNQSEAAAKYDLRAEYQTSRMTDGYLVIDPVPLSSTTAVPINVELDGETFGGCVLASQTVNGVTRTVSGYCSSYHNEPLTLLLYPDIETHFRLDCYGNETYIFEGETLTAPKNGVAHTIKARRVALDVEIELLTDADPAAALRYIKKNRYANCSLVVRQKDVSGNASFHTITSDWFAGDLTARQRISLSGVTSEAACEITFTSPFTTEGSAAAQLKQGEGSAKLSVKLKPGVAVSLRAQETCQCFLAWFDSEGKYIGNDAGIYLTAWQNDFVSVCPAEKAGNYTVALLSINYCDKAYLRDQTLSSLNGEQILTSWPVTLTQTGVVELTPYTADAVTSENAAYVTKPYSTVQANRESFSTVSDVLCFSGSIGLDPGLENGKLLDLRVDMDGKDVSVSGYVSSIVIDGVSHPVSECNISGGNNYHLELPQPVALPCAYSVYATPAAASADVAIKINADVSYRRGTYLSNQKIGEAVVSRPGASISAFSTYVCQDTVLLAGTAKPGETVTVYDNGVPVSVVSGKDGTDTELVTATWNGEWNARIKLNGTDDVYTTVHELHAVSESGVVSNTVAVIHRKNGPQLMSLNLIVNGGERTGTYFFKSELTGASSVKYRAVFANPGELDKMDEWNGEKVIVKVYLGSGNILFVPAAQQKDGSFIADLGRLCDYIDRAEAIYRPKVGKEDLTQNDGGEYTLTATAEEAAEQAEALSSMRELLTKDKNGKLIFAGITDAQSFTATFDENGKAAVSGGLTETVGAKKTAAVETALSAIGKAYGENGLHYKKLSAGTGSGKNIFEWLNELGEAKAAENKAAGENATLSLSQRTQIFSSEENFDNTRTRFARYATDAAYSAYAAAGNHARYVYGKNTAADIYTVSDYQYDENGDVASGSYRITAALLADTSAAPAIYTASVTVELGPNFKGYAGPAKQNGPKKSRAKAGAADVDASGLYMSFDGKYSDDPGYEHSSQLETNAGDLANHTGAVSGFIANSTNVFSPGMLNVGNGFGIVSMGSAIYHLKKTWDNADYRIGKEVRMRSDLEKLISSTCYKRLTQSKRQLVDEAMEKYKKAEKNYDNWDGWSTGLALGLDVGSVICGAFATAGDKEFAAAGMGLTGLSYAHGATLGKGANKAYQKMITQYEESYRTIKSIFSSHAQQTGLDDCKKLKKDEGNSVQNTINHDPSGIVYEGVIENPVKDATVTLWYAVDADGMLATEANAGKVKKVIPAADVTAKTPVETVQTTGADGKYAWFVPQGLWYVTAEKARLTGSSDADKAATVKVTGVKAGNKALTSLLPVLPEQLDVNIPLVDKTAPVVESVRYTDEGVYVTFSKYMVDTAKGADSVLNAANYTLKTKDGAAAIAGVKAVEQGHTPANIDGKNIKTYTRTVLLVPKTALKAGTQVLLTVKKTVKSYAGTALTADFADSGTVTAQKALGAPVIAGGAKQTAAYGSGVTITLPKDAPEGTNIYYTTDGSAPTKDGNLYEYPFGVTNKMTVKAVAVCPGYPDSAVVSADFVIAEAQQYSLAGNVRVDGTAAPAGLTVTLSGGTYKESAQTLADGSYAFENVPVGSYTLSFAETDAYYAASVKAEIEGFDPWVNLTLIDKNKTPDYTPGDVDGDGKISSADARLALRRSVKLEDYPEGSAQYLACDVDFDGKVTSGDARLILRASVGLEDATKWKKA
ncbi:MAG: chitobiase/beta-hexosaminidase C-terminal domain-containing protein [Clostridia bacterium]|nr:chitobiase/beta-hexosaminidase C-terminal domain-containing protein [Clostridia bacterium]